MTKDGGPAFPETKYSGNSNRHATDEVPGMTLRDWFAGQALAGMLAYPGDDARGSWHNNANPSLAAEHAYAFADAMISERSK